MFSKLPVVDKKKSNLMFFFSILASNDPNSVDFFLNNIRNIHKNTYFKKYLKLLFLQYGYQIIGKFA